MVLELRGFLYFYYLGRKQPPMRVLNEKQDTVYAPDWQKTSKKMLSTPLTVHDFTCN